MNELIMFVQKLHTSSCDVPTLKMIFLTPLMSSYTPVCGMLIKLVRNLAKNGCSIELNTLCTMYLESWIALIVQSSQPLYYVYLWRRCVMSSFMEIIIKQKLFGRFEEIATWATNIKIPNLLVV